MERIFHCLQQKYSISRRNAVIRKWSRILNACHQLKRCFTACVSLHQKCETSYEMTRILNPYHQAKRYFTAYVKNVKYLMKWPGILNLCHQAKRNINAYIWNVNDMTWDFWMCVLIQKMKRCLIAFLPLSTLEMWNMKWSGILNQHGLVSNEFMFGLSGIHKDKRKLFSQPNEVLGYQTQSHYYLHFCKLYSMAKKL